MFLPLAIFNINFMSSNLLLLVSVLVFISLLVNKVGARFGVPTLLLFLLVGMLAGRDGLGIHLENHEVAESVEDMTVATSRHPKREAPMVPRCGLATQ